MYTQAVICGINNYNNRLYFGGNPQSHIIDVVLKTLEQGNQKKTRKAIQTGL